MKDLIWTLDSLKSIEQLDYLWKVIENMKIDGAAFVYFGTKGEGKQPNYLVCYANGEKIAYKGMNHEVDEKNEEYNPENLSENKFNIAELKSVYDQQPKSKAPATRLMSEYWGDNKTLYPHIKSPIKYLDEILALSTAGTPIAKAFEMVINNLSSR